MENWAATVAEVGLLALPKIKGMPLTIQAASLQGYWPMDELAAGTAVSSCVDLVGGNSGTPAGDPVYAEVPLSYPGWPAYLKPTAAAPTFQPYQMGGDPMMTKPMQRGLVT